MRNVACALIMLALPGAVVAQDVRKVELPAGFRVRPDDASAQTSELEFVTMAPGWHVTTGPAAILHDPSRTASGEYRIVGLRVNHSLNLHVTGWTS